MGNQQSLLQDIERYKPHIEDFIYKEIGNPFKIYQHRYQKYEVMAYKTTLNSQHQLPILIQRFKARYQHPYLVSTQFLICEDYSSCGGYYETIIFYQRLFTNLSKIKDIPFPDVLHFYENALKGFQILHQMYGYFQIYEDMFFLGQDSKLKVWCNRDISKNSPETYLIDKTGTQQDMIRKIIYIIDQNTDHFICKINFKQKLFALGVRNFQMSRHSLRQIRRQYNLSVPQRVQCINSLPSEQVQMMLDLYSSNANKMRENNKIQNLLINQHSTVPSLQSYSSYTPNFVRGQYQHSPITQQFRIPQNQRQVPELNLSIIQNHNPQQSMIATFNRRPQTPKFHLKNGIDLSIAKNQVRKNSFKINGNQANLRSKSVPQKNRAMINANNNKHASMDKNISLGIKKPQYSSFAQQNIRLEQKFKKPLQIPSYNPRTYPINYSKSPGNVRANYHVQSGQVEQIPQAASRIDYTYQTIPRYYSQPQFNKSNLQNQNYFQKNVELTRANNHQIFYQNNASTPLNKSTVNNPKNLVQIMKKSNVNVNFVSSNWQQPISNKFNLQKQLVSNAGQNQSISGNNLNHKQQILSNLNSHNSNLNYSSSTNNYIASQYQVRERRKSSKHSKNIKSNEQSRFTQTVNNFNKTSKIDSYGVAISISSPMIQKQGIYYSSKSHQNPFQSIQQSNYLKFQSPLQSETKLHLQVPLDKNSNSQFNAHSASSRYLYSNRQLNDNIPDLKYKKSSPKKNIIKLFDTKLQQLQSFNESKFGTQNSLKQHQNSRVLQIIGRQKKNNSITSAFEDEGLLNKNDEIIEVSNSKNYLKVQNFYKGGDSFTDPKILQILKRPSSKALKSQVSNLKKVSKASKPFDFSSQLVKRPVINKQVKEDILKLDSKRFQSQFQSKYQQKNSLTQFSGFPSLSYLSDINKLQDSFNQQKVNASNQKILSRKSRFSEEKRTNNYKQQNAVSQFYQYDYQSPTYEYSFANKKQVPNQDKDIKAKYGSIINSFKDESASAFTKASDFRVVPEKPFNYLTTFGSNQSLASLQFELSRKQQTLKNRYDNIKESNKEELYQFNNKMPEAFQYKNQLSPSQAEKSLDKNTQINVGVNNRKYNPKIDPDISRDLEIFRKQKQLVIKK